METLHTLFYFFVAIAVLVAFHELGHFWVARKTGVKVIRFSVGFGKTLWSYQKAPDQTQFVISAVPLGGYVKMVDEREGAVEAADLPFAFNRQSVAVRTAIVAAGPLFNLALAVFLFWLVLVLGEAGIRPVLGDIAPQTLAADAGFTAGDEIVSIDETATSTWTSALDELMSRALDGQREIVVKVRNGGDSEQLRVLNLGEDDSRNPEEFYQHLGFKPWSPVIKPVIGKLIEDGVAKQAGLQRGDLIISADGQAIENWQQWVEYIQLRPEIEIHLLIVRNDVQMPLVLTPRKEQLADDKVVGKIGAGVEVDKGLQEAMMVEYSLSPLKAIPVAFSKTWFYSTSTLKMIGKMFIGKASVDNLSGPISIAQYAGQSAEMGFTAFLKFLGLVSVSLGVLNLLPVPVLDGGHLLFYVIEAIQGRPLPDKVQWYFQQLGMILLMGLMVLALFLDLDRLFQ